MLQFIRFSGTPFTQYYHPSTFAELLSREKPPYRAKPRLELFLKIWWHQPLFSFFSFFHTIHSFIQTFIHSFAEGPLLFLHCSQLSRGPPWGAEIRTRACRTTSPRITNWAMPHPKLALPHPKWATPHPTELHRTLWATPRPLSYAAPYTEQRRALWATPHLLSCDEPF